MQEIYRQGSWVFQVGSGSVAIQNLSASPKSDTLVIHPDNSAAVAILCLAEALVPAPVKIPPATPDPVDHPAHYTGHPSGVECIAIAEHLNFCRGNALKYLWRAGSKGDEIEDLKKARWYLDREIARLEDGAK